MSGKRVSICTASTDLWKLIISQARSECTIPIPEKYTDTDKVI